MHNHLLLSRKVRTRHAYKAPSELQHVFQTEQSIKRKEAEARGGRAVNTSGIRSRAAHLAFRSTSGLQHCTHKAAFPTVPDPHPAPKDSISWALPPPNHNSAVLQSKQDSYRLLRHRAFPTEFDAPFPLRNAAKGNTSGKWQ